MLNQNQVEIVRRRFEERVSTIHIILRHLENEEQRAKLLEELDKLNSVTIVYLYLESCYNDSIINSLTNKVILI